MRRRITARLAQLRYASIVRDILAKVKDVKQVNPGDINFNIKFNVDLKKSGALFWKKYAPEIPADEVEVGFDAAHSVDIVLRIDVEVPFIGVVPVDCHIRVGGTRKLLMYFRIADQKWIEQLAASDDPKAVQFATDFTDWYRVTAEGDEYLASFKESFVKAANNPSNYNDDFFRKGKGSEKEAEKRVRDLLEKTHRALEEEMTNTIKQSVKGTLTEWLDEKYKFQSERISVKEGEGQPGKSQEHGKTGAPANLFQYIFTFRNGKFYKCYTKDEFDALLAGGLQRDLVEKSDWRGLPMGSSNELTEEEMKGYADQFEENLDKSGAKPLTEWPNFVDKPGSTEEGYDSKPGNAGVSGEENNGDAGESVVNEGPGRNYGRDVYLVFDIQGKRNYSAHPDGKGGIPSRATRRELEELAKSGKLQYKVDQRKNRRYVVDSNGTALTFKRVRGDKYLSSLPAIMRNLIKEYDGK